MNRDSKERIEEQLRSKPLWRSLDELADSPEFHQYLRDEFPLQAKAWLGKIDRRSFLRYAAGTLALAGMAGGCRWRPQEKIVPYVQQPEDEVLGVPVSFATACTTMGPAVGILVTSHENRPTKIEGNPSHPASLGGTDSITQASLYDLYDPDRSQYIRNLGEISSWDSCIADIRQTLLKEAENGGANVRVLSGSIYSPTLHQQKQAFLKMLPQAKWIQYDPVTRDMARAGAMAAFGQDAQPVYHFDKAERIVSLDSDFLLHGPGNVRYAKDFSDRRRVRDANPEMNRLYSIASWPTITSANADHHVAVKPSQVEGVALALAAALGVPVAGGGELPPSVPREWFDAMVAALKVNAARCVVVPGAHQSPMTHAAVHAVNHALGSQAVTYIDPVEMDPADQMKDLAALVDDMKNRRVGVLIFLGSNAAYNAPADLNFKEYMNNVPYKIHFSRYVDETAAGCTWHVPENHYLEDWSDAKAFDGTVSIVQPLIEALYAGKSAHEFLAAVIGQTRLGYDIVREYWRSRPEIGDSDDKWTMALNDGVIAEIRTPEKQLTPNVQLLPEASGAKGTEILFLPDDTIWDGRFCNNAWQQELPKPLTTLTWDNAAMVSPAMAKDLGVNQGEYVNVAFQGRTLKIPLWIQPDMPGETVCIHLGYGRTAAGMLGNGTGFNAYTLRTSSSPSYANNVTIVKTDGFYHLVATQNHHALTGSETMEGHDVVRFGTIDEFKKNPKFLQKEVEGGSLFEQPKDFREYVGYQWGMVIDTTACIGCNACVTACQAENNIPIVGKSQVQNGREMHWIRIARYFAGGEDQPDTLFQPIACLQCENAPCEVVCPVGATVHSHEGLNQMVYNRCIGTRYCSNNCPYKVRRFNFYKFSAGQPDLIPGNYDYPTLQLMANPDVTVRGRGVMEKCTYCVQRISAGRIEAKKAERELKDGEVITACQQACPTKAIVFGNIADADSEVCKQKRQPHNYTLLDNLLTIPRTSYLGKLTNPNPEIKS